MRQKNHIGRLALAPAATDVAPTAVTNGHDAGSCATKLPFGFPNVSVPFTKHSWDPEYATPPSPDDAMKVMPVRDSYDAEHENSKFVVEQSQVPYLAELHALSLDYRSD